MNLDLPNMKQAEFHEKLAKLANSVSVFFVVGSNFKWTHTSVIRFKIKRYLFHIHKLIQSYSDSRNPRILYTKRGHS
jgi:hypothetical protein